MNAYVADTHALFWYLTASPRLGANAKAAFDEGAKGLAWIYISVISLAELYYVNKKLGTPLDFVKEWEKLELGSQFIFVPFEPSDVLDFDNNVLIPEMHDRIILGMAQKLGLPFLTVDSTVIASGLVSIIW